VIEEQRLEMLKQEAAMWEQRMVNAAQQNIIGALQKVVLEQRQTFEQRVRGIQEQQQAALAAVMAQVRILQKSVQNGGSITAASWDQQR
jgi:hypothetical protein